MSKVESADHDDWDVIGTPFYKVKSVEKALEDLVEALALTGDGWERPFYRNSATDSYLEKWSHERDPRFTISSGATKVAIFKEKIFVASGPIYAYMRLEGLKAYRCVGGLRLSSRGTRVHITEMGSKDLDAICDALRSDGLHVSTETPLL